MRSAKCPTPIHIRHLPSYSVRSPEIGIYSEKRPRPLRRRGQRHRRRARDPSSPCHGGQLVGLSTFLRGFKYRGAQQIVRTRRAVALKTPRLARRIQPKLLENAAVGGQRITAGIVAPRCQRLPSAVEILRHKAEGTDGMELFMAPLPGPNLPCICVGVVSPALAKIRSASQQLASKNAGRPPQSLGPASRSEVSTGDFASPENVAIGAFQSPKSAVYDLLFSTP